MTHWLLALLTSWSTLLGPDDTAAECLVLGSLDARRAQAFVEADPALLATVYAAPELRDADARVLAGYTERGLRLRGMAQLRSSCDVLERADERVVLDVVDRLGPTEVEGADGARLLPEDRPTRRTVTLVSTADGWRLLGSR